MDKLFRILAAGTDVIVNLGATTNDATVLGGPYVQVQVEGMPYPIFVLASDVKKLKLS